MSPASPRRRALGQHFLRDSRIIERIVESALSEARSHGCRALLEIGPGRGALTTPLLERLAAERGGIERLLLVEKDSALAGRWAEAVAESASGFRLEVENADFLRLPEERWLAPEPDAGPLAVVSNLPYSTGTAILDRLARNPARIPVMVLMFQAEVAARLRAEPSTKAWGSLSVWIQNRWDVSKLCSAPPGAFAPPPDVHSEVVVLRARAEPRVAIEDETQWESLVRAGFAYRRKMLRSGLAGTPFHAALGRSGVDATLRAEALSWEQWAALYRALGSQVK